MSQLSYRQLPADLGFEAPLTSEGAVVQTLVRGRVNARWLIGIVLTGVTGAGLMLLSVAGALGPLRNAVSPPQLAKNARDDRASASSAAITARRGDKLVRRINLVASRQDYKVPVLVKVGDAEVTRHAGFTRLATPLALESLGFAESIPAFNLAKLVSLASEDRTALDNEAGVASDSEVGLSLRDIATARNTTDSGILMRDQDAYSQVIDTLSERRRDTVRDAAQSRLAKVMRAPSEGSTLLSFSAGVGDPFSKLVVKMVPENVSLLPRQDAVLMPMPVEERLVLSRNENATNQTLRGAGANPRQIKEIVGALTQGGKANALEGNRILKLTLQPAEPGATRELMRVELFSDEQLVASTGRRDDGSFWPIEVREAAAKPKTSATSTEADDEDETAEANPGRLTLYSSIHETARRHDIAPAIIDEAIRTVFFDVDLQRRVGPGDSIEMLVANHEGDNARPELLLVSLATGGVKRRYYRFKLPEDEIVDYFDDQGRSVKQFLLRKPIDGGELRSGFGMRRHPITRSYRLHAGVDWAGPVGTPIRAAGNGVVRMAEWDSGYGRRVEIEHNHGYVTTYNHMSAFGPGIIAGARVRQGQVIGRLGSSGLSTGPHLHYEVMIGERVVDPLAIKLPKGRELAGRQLANFKRDRDHIEAVLKQAPGSNALVAQN